MGENNLRYKIIIDAGRILSVFETSDEKEIGVKDIAGSLSMAPSKVSRMLKSMEAEGFVSQSPESNKYRIGSRFMRLAFNYSMSHPLRSLILPHIQQIANELRTLTTWAIFEHKRITIIDRLTISKNPVHLMAYNLPLHSSAYGKLFLSQMTECQQKEMLCGTELVQYTAKTVVDIDGILRQLKITKERKYAVDIGETHEENNMLAFPIMDAKGRIVAGIGISESIDVLNMEGNEKVINYLKEKALFISNQIGYQL